MSSTVCNNGEKKSKESTRQHLGGIGKTNKKGKYFEGRDKEKQQPIPLRVLM